MDRAGCDFSRNMYDQVPLSFLNKDKIPPPLQYTLYSSSRFLYLYQNHSLLRPSPIKIPPLTPRDSFIPLGVYSDFRAAIIECN